MTKFQQATNITPTGKKGEYTGTIESVYNVGIVPNGGYIASLALKSMVQYQKSNDRSHVYPFVLDVYFLRPCTSGKPYTVQVEDIKCGNKTTSLRCTFTQDNKEKAIFSALFGTYSTESAKYYKAPALYGKESLLTKLPQHPEDGVQMNAKSYLDKSKKPSNETFVKRLMGEFEIMTTQDQLPYSLRLQKSVGYPIGDDVIKQAGDSKSSNLGFSCFIRFDDGHVLDSIALPLVADMMIPTIKGDVSASNSAWVPTMHWTINFVDKLSDNSEWVKGVFETKAWGNDRVVEDCEFYDPKTNKLVFMARQHAMVNIVQDKSKL